MSGIIPDTINPDSNSGLKSETALEVKSVIEKEENPKSELETSALVKTQEFLLTSNLFVSSNNWKYLQSGNRSGYFTHYLPDRIKNITECALESISTSNSWFNLIKEESVEIWITLNGRQYYKKNVFKIEAGYYRKISDLVGYINLKIEEAFEMMHISDNSTLKFFMPTLKFNNNRVYFYYGRSLLGEFTLLLLSEKLRSIFKLPQECSLPSGMYNYVGMLKSSEDLIDVAPYGYNMLILKSSFTPE